MIVLDDGRARAEVHPEAGAAIGTYDFIASDGRAAAIFQTARSRSRSGPFALGLNLLIPFSNRIAGGGFRHNGVFYPLERNGPGPYPIHGNAFDRSWTVCDVSPTAVSLTLASDAPGPFRYDAEVHYALEDGMLQTRLVVVNRAPVSLPFGAGLHPWFVRTPATRLTMTATGYWTETPDHLPDVYLPTANDAHFDFSSGRLLPATFFNNALTGWNGRATLEWPDRGLKVELAAAAPLTTAILYSPSSESDFVCIEPVSHSVDAHNRTDRGTAPPQVLQPGEAITAAASFMPCGL